MNVKNVFVSFFCGLLGCAAAPAAEVFSSKAYNDDGGARIFFGGSYFARGARFTVHSPGWTERYVRNIRHGGHLKFELKNSNGDSLFQVSETNDRTAVLDGYSVKCDGDTATVTVQARMLENTPALVEHVIGIAPWVFENAKYEVTLSDGSVKTGILPEAERYDDATELLPPFVRGVFRTRGAETSIEVVEGPPFLLNDRRSSRPLSWGKSFILWTANFAMPVPGKVFRQVVKFKVTRPRSSLVAKCSLTIPGDYIEAVAAPAEEPPRFPLVPQPQKCRFTGVDYQVAPGDKLLIPFRSERLLRHARKFAAKYGLEVAADNGRAARGIRVSYGDDADDESYTIRVGKNGATVRAKGERGAFYALQTLRALERDRVFRGAEIEDFPAFPKRAIHANADSDTRAFTGELIEKVLAPLKINTIILECPYVNWNATSGKHRYKGMPKEDLPEFLRIAGENYIKVYPLIPTYSHSEWFFWNGKDAELKENPKDPRSYDALKPQVYEKLSALFDEVLEAFGHPEYFHISHDELHENPTQDAGKKLGVAKLFYNDVMWHHEFFKKRGVKLMMWHDMLVGKAENHGRPVANARGGTEMLRKTLPKDITVCMWDYYQTKDGKYFQIDCLQQDGFPVWCAGWFFPGNLEMLASYAREKKVLGMIETTWHNKVGSGGLLQTQYPQLKAYVRAAALFWNPEYRPLPDTARVFVDLMRPAPRPEAKLYPQPVKCNALLREPGDDFDKLPETLRTRDGVVFKLAKDDRGVGAVMVESAATPDFPKKVRIPLRGKCRRLYLLDTVLEKATGKDGAVVKLVLRYKDGGVAAIWPRNNIDIAYGTPPEFKENGKIVSRVAEVGTPRADFTFTLNHRNVFEWRNGDGQARRVWYLEWENPHPDRELDHLLVEAIRQGAPYALFAVTLEK